jgi:hypothetical protein
MAVVQISRIQHRRGLQQDLPNLSSAELGWTLDERRLFIGNGTLVEGAPVEGRTEILTEHTDILALANGYTFKGLSAGFQVVTGIDALHPIVRTLQDKLDDYVSVKDFGAVGNGINDDGPAIQRALERTYGSSQSQIASGKHRTIVFPAGTYRISGTINIPPYSRIQGEGKRTTTIEGSFAGPIARFVDSFGQYGEDFGAPTNSGVEPETAEYHISDLSFIHKSLDYDQSCLVIDGAFTATFNRVMFRGSTADVSATYGSSNPVNPIYDIDRGPGVAAVDATNRSQYAGVRNLVFTQCDFMDHNYGIELDQEVIGISITSCFFDHCYHHIMIGQGLHSYAPYGVSIYNNYFRYSAMESIKSAANCDKIMSLSNIFSAAGLGDYPADTPVVNPSGLAQSPAITFNADNNFSIADTFDRNDNDYELFPNIETNGYNCYIVGQDLGIVNGRITTGVARTVTLEESASQLSLDVKYIPTSYTNMAVNYSIMHGDASRVGTLKIAQLLGTYTWDDEYVETADAGVELLVNGITGDIEYTSTVIGEPIVVTSSIEYFKA